MVSKNLQRNAFNRRKNNSIFPVLRLILPCFRVTQALLTKSALIFQIHNRNAEMMAIGIASIMHHASDGIIWHVLIVIIGNQAPYSYGSNITSEHHPILAQW